MATFRAPLQITVISTQLTIPQLQTLSTDLVPVHQAAATNLVINCSDQLDAATISIKETFENNQTQCSSAPASKTKTGLEAMATVSITDDRLDLFQLATNGKATNAAPVVALSSTTLGSPTVTSLALFANVLVGYRVTGAGIPANTFVTAKASSSSITLSAAATATGNAIGFTYAASTPSLVRLGDDSGLTTRTVESPLKTVVFRPYTGGVPTTNQANWFVFPACGIEGSLDQSFGLGSQYSYQISFTAYDFAPDANTKVLRGNTALLT